jgi:hypothetical protein
VFLLNFCSLNSEFFYLFFLLTLCTMKCSIDKKDITNITLYNKNNAYNL